MYAYVRLLSRHGSGSVRGVVWPLQLYWGGFVVVLGMCDLGYVGLYAHERLRLTDVVVSCWTMCGPDQVGLWGRVGLCSFCFPRVGLDRVWSRPLGCVPACLCP